MPEQKADVNIKVVCPTMDLHGHNSWCYENRTITTSDWEERKNEPTYTRIFNDPELAHFFRLDFRINK